MSFSGRAMMSPSAMSSSHSGVELSHFHPHDSDDEKHLPAATNLHTEEHDLEPKHVNLELKRPKSDIVSSEDTANHHEICPTVMAIRKWYQIRGWSLIYPLIVSLYLAIGELEFNLRTIGYVFIVFSCVFCLLHLKNFGSQKNMGFALLKILCILVIVSDFLFQYSFVGDQGWVATESYQSCYNFTGIVHNKGLREWFCSIFKALYYLHSLVYLTSVSSFAIYLFATSRLLKLVNRGGDGNGYITQLDDEIDFEEEEVETEK